MLYTSLSSIPQKYQNNLQFICTLDPYFKYINKNGKYFKFQYTFTIYAIFFFKQNLNFIYKPARNTTGMMANINIQKKKM